MGHLGPYKGLLECYVGGPLSYISFNQSEQLFTKVEVNNGEYLQVEVNIHHFHQHWSQQ